MPGGFVDPRQRHRHGRTLVDVDSEDRHVGLVEQTEMVGVGHNELALGVRDVASEVGPAAGRVDTDNGAARKRSTAEPEAVLRDVVEQYADMRLASGVQPVR